jgi:hypothetical protein
MKFRGFSSEYVTIELKKTKDDVTNKRDNMLALIPKYNLITLEATDEIDQLADIYITDKVISILNIMMLFISLAHQLIVLNIYLLSILNIRGYRLHACKFIFGCNL